MPNINERDGKVQTPLERRQEAIRRAYEAAAPDVAFDGIRHTGSGYRDQGHGGQGGHHRYDYRDLQRIVRDLGGSGHAAHCPAHDDQTMSLSVHLSADGKLLVKCHAKHCTQAQVVAAFRARGLWPDWRPWSPSPPEDYRRRQAERRRVDDLNFKIKRDRALEILRACEDDPEKVGPYLRGRGIDLLPSTALWLSQRTAGQFRHFGLLRFPCAVFPIMRGTQVLGCHVTQLNAHGTAKLVAKTPRKIFGPYSGGYVVLGDQPTKHDTLIVGEGIETVLSYMQLFDYCCGIAALSATNLHKIDPPQCGEIIVAADNDADGQGLRAAEELGQKLADRSIAGHVEIPPRPKDWTAKSYDWNDALLGRRR